MRISRLLIATIITCSALILACAQVPTQQVWRPWIRTVHNERTIPAGSRLSTAVSGQTKPLLGDERLVANKLEESLDHLLERRGFVVSDSEPEFRLSLSYQTERVEKQSMLTISSQGTRADLSYSAGVGAGATSGLGISIARAVGMASMQTLQRTTQVSETSVYYNHTVSAEIVDENDASAWKGESTWDSRELDITSDILPSLQLLLSDLPTSAAVRPEVPEVKESHAANYYRLECKGRWFTCPALPFRIQFKETLNIKDASDIPGVKDYSALAAYVDLLQTAEYALPEGSERYNDPLKLQLWSHVGLGGLYDLGPSHKQVAILIDLSGESSGYHIESCRIATDEEWAQFQAKMREWRQALKVFYDYFE